MVVVVFTFLFVDMFDTIGTLVGVTTKAGMIDKNGKIPHLKQDWTPTKPSSFTAQMVYIMIPVLGYLLIKSAKTQTQT